MMYRLRRSDVVLSHSDVAPVGRSDVMCSASRAKRTSLAKHTSRPKGTSRSACGTHRSKTQKTHLWVRFEVRCVDKKDAYQ